MNQIVLIMIRLILLLSVFSVSISVYSNPLFKSKVRSLIKKGEFSKAITVLNKERSKQSRKGNGKKFLNNTTYNEFYIKSYIGLISISKKHTNSVNNANDLLDSRIRLKSNVLDNEINESIDSLLNVLFTKKLHKHAYNLSLRQSNVTGHFSEVFHREHEPWNFLEKDLSENFNNNYDVIDSFVKSGLNFYPATYSQLARFFSKSMPGDDEKARAIFIWIRLNISYDYSYKISSPKETFSKRKGVCQGQAMLFYKMCLEAGVECRTVSGYALNSKFSDEMDKSKSRHMWNIVTINGFDYIIDPTWGYFKIDPKISLFTHYPKKFEDQLIDNPIETYELFLENRKNRFLSKKCNYTEEEIKQIIEDKLKQKKLP